LHLTKGLEVAEEEEEGIAALWLSDCAAIYSGFSFRRDAEDKSRYDEKIIFQNRNRQLYKELDALRDLQERAHVRLRAQGAF